MIGAKDFDGCAVTLDISKEEPNRARRLYKNISMLFLFPVTRDLLFTNIGYIID